MKIIYKCDNSICSNFNTTKYFDNIWVTTNNFEIMHDALIPLIINECLELDCNSNAYSFNTLDKENLSYLL